MERRKTLFTLIISLIFVFGSISNIYGQEKPDKSTKSDPNTPIFEIKNDQGQTVFAVYPGGVKIFIDDQLKAAGGGFTIGRISTEKATSGEYFIVNPNNVKVLIDETIPGLKAAGGGFTVGRISTEKAAGDEENFFTVTPDSTRVYVAETSTNGFAVGKLGAGSAIDFLNLTPDNYFIGHNTGSNITTGKYNSLIGFESGKNIKTANNNVYLGHSTGFSNTSGNDNVFIGNRSGYSLSGGYDNIFIGNLAGENSSGTTHSTFIGSEAGRNLIGDNNICIGDRTGTNDYATEHEFFASTIVGIDAGRNMTGHNNVIMGTGTGSSWGGLSTGSNNVFIGAGAGGGGHLTRLGSDNVCIGYDAGNGATGSDKLYIANSDTGSPLIYGEFKNNLVRINGDLQYTGEISHFSDIRLKTNLIPITSALKIVNSITGYYFDWNDNAVNQLGLSKKKQIGFVAQEVEKLLPELVTSNANSYKSIDYTKINSILVEAVKEQQKIIGKLENRINEIEKKHKILKTEVSEIHNLKLEINELKAMVKEIAGVTKESKSESAK